MPLPEYVAPVLAVADPTGLVLVILRFGPDAVLRLLVERRCLPGVGFPRASFAS